MTTSLIALPPVVPVRRLVDTLRMCNHQVGVRDFRMGWLWQHVWAGRRLDRRTGAQDGERPSGLASLQQPRTHWGAVAARASCPGLLQTCKATGPLPGPALVIFGSKTPTSSEFSALSRLQAFPVTPEVEKALGATGKFACWPSAACLPTFHRSGRRCALAQPLIPAAVPLWRAQAPPPAVSFH